MTHQKTLSRQSWADLALLSLIWGGSYLAFSLALREIGVFTTVAFRVGGGAVLLWGYIMIRRLPVPRDLRIWGAFAVMGILNNAIPFTLIAWGQLYVPSGLASILNASTAVFGIVIAAIVFSDERLTARKLLGVGLGFAGVSATIGLDVLREFNLTSLAQIALIGASISYACAGSWGRKMMSDLPPQVSAAGMTTMATLFMVPMALYVDGRPTLNYGIATWGALIQLAVFATAWAYLLYYRILNTAGSGNLLLVTLMVTPIAIALGAVVLGEELNASAYVGFGFLAAGLLVIDGRILQRIRILQ